MGPFVKAAVFGAVLAVVAVAVLVALGLTGRLPAPPAIDPPDRVLIIATGYDNEGAEVAATAFVLDRDGDAVTILDTEATVTVPGTSAHSPAEAYPFGGGTGVSRALAKQTQGEELPWIVLPATTWSELVDSASGIQVEVPSDISAYRNGTLVLLDEGRQTLSGDEAIAVVSSAGFIDDETERAELVSDVTSSLSAVVSSDRAELARLIAAKKAQTSLTEEALSGFVGAE